jgi:hypothetical protein
MDIQSAEVTKIDRIQSYVSRISESSSSFKEEIK